MGLTHKLLRLTAPCIVQARFPSLVESGSERHETDSESEYLPSDDDQSLSDKTENTGVKVETVYDEEEDDGRSVFSDAEDMFPSASERAPPMSDQFQEAADRGEQAANNDKELPKRKGKPSQWVSQDFVNALFDDYNEDQLFDMMTNGQLPFSFVTAQMSAKAAIKRFGKAGEDAIIKELEQLVYRKVDGREEGKRPHS